MTDAGSNNRKVPLWRSVRLRIFLSYLLIVSAVMAVVNTYPIYTMQNSVFHMKQTSLENQATVIASAFSSLSVLDEAGVDQVMCQLDTSGLNRVMITDNCAKILFDTTEFESGVGKYAMTNEITQALKGQDVFHVDYTDLAFRSRAAVPIFYRGALLGCVYVYEYDTEQAALLADLQNNIKRLTLILVAVSFVICILITSSITRKVALLLAGIQQMGNGNWTNKVDLRGHDEINALADEFNDLTERLSQTEEVRRRFVADASHELKTPLASIRLLTDSILQTERIDSQTVREFVSDIGEEAGRLTRITEKLLALTRLDTGAVNAATEVQLKNTVERVIQMLRPLAEQKSVSLEFHCESPGEMEANEDDLYQIVFNLTENAVKYNIPGGSVVITLRQDKDKIDLLVEDTGIGIPNSESDKIYERFYRVDKARSRAAGGTGLGLSIVKDMVTRYNGGIQNGKRPQGGSWFRVSFPQ